jgi:hypothetical protein
MSSSPLSWNHLTTTLASLTTAVGGIARIPAFTDHISCLEGANVAQRTSPTLESGRDASLRGLAELSARRRLDEPAPAVAAKCLSQPFEGFDVGSMLATLEPADGWDAR